LCVQRNNRAPEFQESKTRRRDKKYSSGDEKTIAKDEAVRPGESFCILVR
jgi:hypothetical protein